MQIIYKIILNISVGPVHMAMDAIAYYSGLVHSKKLVRREFAFTMGYEKNPVNWSRIGPKFEWYGKVNPKSGQFTNVLFHSCVNRKRQVQFRSTFWTCWGSTGTCKCISLTKLVTLSQYIRETLFSCQCF